MFKVYKPENTIVMSEYDYGESLPITITNAGILPTDTLRFRIRKDEFDNEIIIEKSFENLSEEEGVIVIALDFSSIETKKLPTGNYVYGMDLYRDDELKETFIDSADFIVKKAV